MTLELTEPEPRRLLQSTGAIVAGFATVIVLTTIVDIALHALGVFPPWGEPMREPALNLLAVAYRCVFTLAGGWVAAWLAPRAPATHAFILGAIGLVPGVAGVVATSGMDLGPRWFPIAVAVTGPPFAWLGGLLYRAWRARR